MKSHSVIYIDEGWEGRKPSLVAGLMAHFDVAAMELPSRIVTSFVPPVKSKKAYVDLVGPFLAVVMLASMLHYGHTYKEPSAALETSPTLLLVCYSFTMPSLSYFLVKLGGSSLGLADVIAVIGYGLYGHVATIATSLLFNDEESNVFFFLMMVVFGGLSGLRIVVILLMTIPRPPARLLVCSLVSILHLLFLIFVHFAYMHRTFVYGHHPD